MKYKQNISLWNTTYYEDKIQDESSGNNPTPQDDEPDYGIFTKDMDKRNKSKRTRTRLPRDNQSLYDRWTSTGKPPTRWWWPGEYGWEPDFPLKKK